MKYFIFFSKWCNSDYKMTFVYREKLGIKLKYFSAIFPYETKKIEKKMFYLFIYLFRIVGNGLEVCIFTHATNIRNLKKMFQYIRTASRWNWVHISATSHRIVQVNKESQNYCDQGDKCLWLCVALIVSCNLDAWAWMCFLPTHSQQAF